MNKVFSVLTNCFSGFYQILQSLSGVFSLITLFVIAIVTWHSSTIGGIALSAFATVVPSILAYTENKEALQAVALAAQQAVANPAAVVVQTPIVITNTISPTSSDLPPNGTL